MSEARLELLERMLRRLAAYAREVSRERLENDLDSWLMVTRAMELMAQCCVDLAMTIVARRGLAIPDTYRARAITISRPFALVNRSSGVLLSASWYREMPRPGRIRPSARLLPGAGASTARAAGV